MIRGPFYLWRGIFIVVTWINPSEFPQGGMAEGSGGPILRRGVLPGSPHLGNLRPWAVHVCLAHTGGIGVCRVNPFHQLSKNPLGHPAAHPCFSSCPCYLTHTACSRRYTWQASLSSLEMSLPRFIWSPGERAGIS